MLSTYCAAPGISWNRRWLPTVSDMLLISLSFSNCWGQRVKSAHVYLLDRTLRQLWQCCRGRFSSYRWWHLGCCEGPPVPVLHRNWQGNTVPYVASLQLGSLHDLLIVLSAWSVRHSLALFLSFRMLHRRSPSGEGLNGWKLNIRQGDGTGWFTWLLIVRQCEAITMHYTTHFACCLNQSRHLV